MKRLRVNWIAMFKKRFVNLKRSLRWYTLYGVIVKNWIPGTFLEKAPRLSCGQVRTFKTQEGMCAGYNSHRKCFTPWASTLPAMVTVNLATASRAGLTACWSKPSQPSGVLPTGGHGIISPATLAIFSLNITCQGSWVTGLFEIESQPSGGKDQMITTF